MYNMKRYWPLTSIFLLALLSCASSKPSASTTVNTATPPVQISETQAPKTNRNPQPANGLPITPSIDPDYIKRK